MSGGPPTALPWWMGTAIVLVWLAVIGGIVAILIRRRRWSAASRGQRDHRGTPDRGLPDGAPPHAELGPARDDDED